MADFVTDAERSKELQAWFNNLSNETLRLIRDNIAKRNPLMERLLKEGKVKEADSNG